ncbi:3-deoxy-D-manno-octulosonic-acid transferase [Saccharicrinis carchari]|uniref:3-deoxy-D-manno-octulosonic acid transferase n=1 Tax=Saccharicrinis carchari TaxID=1168039 RepID=A0A521ELK4_SACCC|nr:glycosyltransferase N-terminal domain-containing protein [Saccharicrinis carchari]SMO84797.1 3-deoxy-D-manno-octulosonic-acid transferase [Saccharicrinis carchari]
MSIVYNLGIFLYSALLWLLSPFNHKAKKLHRGRADTMRRISELHIKHSSIWIHCASLGEFEQGRPIIEAIKRKKPSQKIVLTFFSPSGYEVQKNYALADEVFYLPADRPANAKKLIRAIKPKQVIFVKYEFWFHYLNQLHRSGIDTYIVSAIFRPQHAFFRWYGGWYKKMLRCFTKLYVQDEESAQLLANIGITNCQVSGDTRFDRVYQIAQNAREYPQLALFAKGHKVIVGGSTWPTGEKLLSAYLKHNPDCKLLLAPHEIHEEHMAQIETAMKPFGCARYTALQDVDPEQLRVLIVDTMGMLSSMYRYGDVAYIGGGFGSGIHNTLEAATFGLPVIIGPNYQKYQEACDLIQLGGGFCIHNSSEFNQRADNLLKNTEQLATASRASVDYVNNMRGATQTIIKELIG